MGMNYSGGKVDGSSAKVTGISFDSHLDYEGQKVTSKNAIADPVKNDVVDLSDFVGAFYKKTPEEIEAERRAEALRKAEEERKRQEEERKRKAAEEERKRQEELKRLEEAKRAEAARQAEAARLAEEKRKQEEAAAAAAASQKKGGWSLLGALSSAWDAVTETAAKVVDTAVSIAKSVVTDPIGTLEKAAATVVEVGASAVKGVVGVAENVIDGLVQVGGAAVAYGATFSNWAFGTDIDVQSIKDTTQSIVSFNASDWLYDNTVGKSEWIQNNSVAPDWLLNGAEMIGTMAGYTVLSMIPGVGGTLVAAAAAAGSAANQAYANGATFDQATACSIVAGVSGAASKYALNGVHTSAKTATSMAEVVKYTCEGAAVSATIEPILNTGAQYLTYGRNLVDENGNPLDLDFLEYASMTGLGKQMLIGGAAGGISTFKIANKSYQGTQTYRKDVLDKEINNRVEKAEAKGIKEEYDNLHGKGSYDKLDDAAKERVKNNSTFTLSDSDREKIAQAAKNDLEKHINDSINNVKSDVEAGQKYQSKYTVGEILEGSQNGDQAKYWSLQGKKDYFGQFGIELDANGNLVDPNTKINVYTFQDGTPGHYNLFDFNGNIGRPGPNGGAFVMSEKDYLDLIADRTIFDASGNCINPNKLSDVLGGPSFKGDVIAIQQTLNASEISLPNGTNNGAFPGYWSPGGHTIDVKSGQATVTEALAPRGTLLNGNAIVISHNGNVTNAQYAQQVQKYIDFATNIFNPSFADG